MGKSISNDQKDMVRAVLMEELIDKCNLLNAKCKVLEAEIESLRPDKIEDRKQLSYIN